MAQWRRRVGKVRRVALTIAPGVLHEDPSLPAGTPSRLKKSRKRCHASEGCSTRKGGPFTQEVGKQPQGLADIQAGAFRVLQDGRTLDRIQPDGLSRPRLMCSW